MKIGPIETIPMSQCGGKWAFLKELKPGQSVLVEGVARASIASAAFSFFGKGGSSVRKEGEGLRIWRIK